MRFFPLLSWFPQPKSRILSISFDLNGNFCHFPRWGRRRSPNVFPPRAPLVSARDDAVAVSGRLRSSLFSVALRFRLLFSVFCLPLECYVAYSTGVLFFPIHSSIIPVLQHFGLWLCLSLAFPSPFGYCCSDFIAPAGLIARHRRVNQPGVGEPPAWEGER